MIAKVLVVDDSMMVRAQVSRVLTEAGFSVTTANDGLDALGKLDADTRLIVCEVNMPRMNGLEFLEELRVARKNHVPFVMLTTEDQLEMVARAKAMGANSWLVKPLEPELLVSTARKLTSST
jgi:two-component system chemotaxis response regulator CheY